MTKTASATSRHTEFKKKISKLYLPRVYVSCRRGWMLKLRIGNLWYLQGSSQRIQVVVEGTRPSWTVQEKGALSAGAGEIRRELEGGETAETSESHSHPCPGSK